MNQSDSSGVRRSGQLPSRLPVLSERGDQDPKLRGAVAVASAVCGTSDQAAKSESDSESARSLRLGSESAAPPSRARGGASLRPRVGGARMRMRAAAGLLGGFELECRA